MKNILTKIFITSFFGYNNWKFLIIQLMYVLSNKESFFSEKRIHANIAFATGWGIMVFHVIMARHTMTNYEAAADVIIMMGVAGYQISQVQKEKIEDKKPDLSNTPPAPPDPTPTPPVQ